ncbi:MAG TPA: acetaldehyde dehydrogenase (acetylating) [Myxococcales bacterium]|nr:acetaldehyde dehydrogenase (acetylating) [Myxococcales bacterium]
MSRFKAAIIGSGNIGTDLLYKALRSHWVEPVWMVGIDPDSEGLARARELGLKTTHEGVAGLVPHAEADGLQLAFDATSAYVHQANYEALIPFGVKMIDLTPAAIGPYCIPPVNLATAVARDESNINMVSCGGQATIPMVAAVHRVQPVEYGEIVATVASRSIGPGTRNNIDEFTRTTRAGIEAVGGAKVGKAIIIINPAEPPIMMRDTIHCVVAERPDEDAIRASVEAMIEEVKTYVPGYLLKNGPIFEPLSDGRWRISTFLEVQGLGDYLPTYAGNLDIMTAAALRCGELIAQGAKA